ncbi:FUS3-complementing protein 2 isoform 1 [Hibiscus syriacus]|uniref:FUS3-complementing protein 2 isoform 1 n=1 Tax=Hibiscus syriacus TaxID=106335 RepID=A0A6A2YUZ3_HIBSY|nr:FUS3-complementing protein 2 isoform 1 [Hibiscus syriacus]
MDPLFLLPLIFIFSLLILLKLAKRRPLHLPPSPPKLPIIGNIHQLGKLPHRSFRQLSRNYGSLLLLQLGSNPTLVVSSAEMVREIVKNHDIAFSDKPKTTAVKEMFYDAKGLGFSPYGEFWRQVKKMSVVELLSNRECIRFSSMKSLSKELDEFLDEVIEEHRALENHEQVTSKKDFVSIIMQLQKDGMLEMDLTQDNIKAILMDLFVAGTDTTITTDEWAMTELLKNENAMKKVQIEVRTVVGNNLGYDIPSGTNVMVNSWAIHRDPERWERKSSPRRDSRTIPSFSGSGFSHPIRFRKKSMSGMLFGVASVEYVIANLLYWFDWKLPAGETAENLT